MHATAHDPQLQPYRDRKRLAWLLSLLVPASVTTGPALMLMFGTALLIAFPEIALWLPRQAGYGGG